MDAAHRDALELIRPRATTGRTDAISGVIDSAVQVAALDLLVVEDIAPRRFRRQSFR